jgi:L-fuculose-phosphate aldolase
VNEDQERSVIIECCRRLYDRGFFPGVDGNVSLRVDGGRMLITPTGVCKGTVSERQLSLMSLEGEHISGDKPSTEAQMHIAAFKRREEINACIHAHSPNIGAFALTGEPVDTRCAPYAYMHLGIIGEVKYMTPGTAGLHETVGTELDRGFTALLLFGHGSLVLGSDMQEAFERIDLFESYAGTLLRAQLLGGAKALDDDELFKVRSG